MDFGRKTNRYLFLLCTLLGVLFALITPVSHPTEAATGINQTVNFQGRLLTSSGATVPDGYYNLQFKIYQDGDGLSAGNTTGSPTGTLKWTENYLNQASQGVRVQNGYMSVQLGSITAFGSSVDWNQSVLWLSMNVGNTNGSCTPFSSCSPDGEMLPMQPLTSAVYALNSNQLGGLTSSQFGQIAGTNTFTAANVFQPTTNVTGVTVIQNTSGAPTADIFSVQSQNNTQLIQVTGSSANNAAITLRSLGTGNAITLNSAEALNFTANANSIWDLGAGHTLYVQTGNNGGITTGSGTLTVGGNQTFNGTTARTITGPSTGGLTVTVANGPLTISTTGASGTRTLALNSSAALNITASGASTWDVGASTLSLQTTNNGDVTMGSGTFTAGGNLTFSGATPLISTSTSNAGLGILANGTGTLSLGTSGAGTINIGTANTTTIGIGNTVSGTAITSTAGAVVNTLSNTGNLLKTNTNSTTAFAVQNAGSLSVLNVNTTTPQISMTSTAAYSTNSVPLLNVSYTTTNNSGGTETGQQITVSDTGIVNGLLGGTDATYGLNVAVTRTGATGGTINSYGAYVSANVDNAGGGISSAWGLHGVVSGTVDTGTGVAGGVLLAGSANSGTIIGTSGTVGSFLHTGTVTTVAGIQAAISNTGGAGVYTTAYGAQILTGTTGNGGTIGTLYGLQVQPQSAGGTANYGAAIGTAGTQTLWLGYDTNTSYGSNTGIAFGSARDTNLYRSAASVLQTDGSFLIKTTSNSTTALDVRSSGNNSIIQVDTSGSRVGINLGTGSNSLSSGKQGLDIVGALRLGGGGNGNSAVDIFTTPVGSNVETKINIPLYDPGANAQLIALGLPSSTASATSRVISVFDARTVSHQPSIATFSPDENSNVGFTWNGSNTTAVAQTSESTGSTDGISLQSGNSTTSGSTGAVVVQSGNATSGASGNVTIDAGTATTTVGTVGIGTTNARTINVGNTTAATATTIQGGTGGTAISLTQGTGGTIVIGGTGAASTTSVQCGAGTGVTCGFANNATDHTTYVGSSTGTSATNIQSGSGALTLAGGSIGLNGATISTNQATVGFLNTNVATITALQAATSISMGGTTGTFTIRNANTVLGNAVGSGLFTNNGATVNSTLALSNFASGGSIGSANVTVDIYTSISVAQTTGSQTLTIPSPTANTAYGRMLYLSNIGTASFTVGTVTLNAGATATLIWSNTNGASSWQFAGTDSSPILNQNSSDQTANFRISGTGRANTSFTTPLVDAISGGLSLGTTTATSVTLGNATSGTNVSANCGASGTCGFGNNATDHTTTVGSGTGVSATTLQGGSGGVAVKATGTAGFSVQNASGTSVLVVDTTNRQMRVMENGGSTNYALIYYNTATNTANYTANSGTVAVGTGAGAISIQAGSGSAITMTGNAASLWSTTAGTLTLQSGTNSNLILTPSGTGMATISGSAKLVLGQSAGDPGTCTAGAIVYNTSSNTLRGCQGSSPTWNDLINVTTPTIQSTYTASTGGTTAEIKLDTTRGGLDIQGDNAGSVTDLFTVRAGTGSGLGQSLFDVASSGDVTIQSSAGIAVLATTDLDVAIGQGSSPHSTDPVVLVLDNYQPVTAGSAPTQQDGAMYYNADQNVFMCGLAGKWVNCAINSIQSSYVFEDEFLGGTTAAATGTSFQGVGALGWNVNATTSCAAAYNQTGPALAHDHPGTLRLTTAAVNGNGCAMTQAGTAAGTATLSQVIGVGDVFKTNIAIGAQTGTMRIGWTNQTSNTAPTSGAWWEYVNGSDATHLRYCYANNAAATCAAGPVIAANTWAELEIYINATNNITFVVNIGGTNNSYTTTNTFDPGTTNKLGPTATCYASTTTALNCYIDYIQWSGVNTSGDGLRD